MKNPPYSWSPSACTLQPWQFWCGRCYHDALVRSDIENVGKARKSHQIPWSVREYHNFIIMFINFLIRIFSNWKGMNGPSKLGCVRQTRHGSQVTLAARRAVTLSVAPAAKLKNLRHFQWHLHSSHSSYKSEYLGKFCPLALQRPFLSTAKNGTWLNMRMKSAVGIFCRLNSYLKKVTNWHIFEQRRRPLWNSHRSSWLREIVQWSRSSPGGNVLQMKFFSPQYKIQIPHHSMSDSKTLRSEKWWKMAMGQVPSSS